MNVVKIYAYQIARETKRFFAWNYYINEKNGEEKYSELLQIEKINIIIFSYNYYLLSSILEVIEICPKNESEWKLFFFSTNSYQVKSATSLFIIWLYFYVLKIKNLFWFKW